MSSSNTTANDDNYVSFGHNKSLGTSTITATDSYCVGTEAEKCTCSVIEYCYGTMMIKAVPVI